MFVNIFGEKKEREREREKAQRWGNRENGSFSLFLCVCVFRRNTYLRYPYRSYVVSKSSSGCIRVYNNHRSSCKPPWVLDSVFVVVESVCYYCCCICCCCCFKQEKKQKKTKRTTREKQEKNKRKTRENKRKQEKTRENFFSCLANKRKNFLLFSKQEKIISLVNSPKKYEQKSDRYLFFSILNFER